MCQIRVGFRGCSLLETSATGLTNNIKPDCYLFIVRSWVSKLPRRKVKVIPDFNLFSFNSFIYNYLNELHIVHGLLKFFFYML